MPAILGANSVTGYDVDNSLLFNSADNAELSRTLGSASGEKVFSFSTWVKRSNTGGSQSNYLLYGVDGSSNSFNWYFRNDVLKRREQEIIQKQEISENERVNKLEVKKNKEIKESKAKEMRDWAYEENRKINKQIKNAEKILEKKERNKKRSEKNRLRKIKEQKKKEQDAIVRENKRVRRKHKQEKRIAAKNN